MGDVGERRERARRGERGHGLLLSRWYWDRRDSVMRVLCPDLEYVSVFQYLSVQMIYLCWLP